MRAAERSVLRRSRRELPTQCSIAKIGFDTAKTMRNTSGGVKYRFFVRFSTKLQIQTAKIIVLWWCEFRFFDSFSKKLQIRTAKTMRNTDRTTGNDPSEVCPPSVCDRSPGVMRKDIHRHEVKHSFLDGAVYQSHQTPGPGLYKLEKVHQSAHLRLLLSQGPTSADTIFGGSSYCRQI